MKLPKFIQSLNNLQSNKLMINIKSITEFRKQVITGNTIKTKVYDSCIVTTNNKQYYKSLCNTFGVKSEFKIIPSLDEEVKYYEAYISKYNLYIQLV